MIGSTAYLKYLSKEPTDPVFTYQDDNVLEGTLQLTTTEMTEVVNDLWVTWQKRYSQREPERLHYKNAESVVAYGRKKRDLQIWVYRHKALVQKTAQFWFNRWSRVWRKMRLITDLDQIEVTVYDDVRSALSELETLGMTEMVEHDTENYSIATMVWTPVEVGTCVQSTSAYLDDTGDSAPATPTFADPGDVAEVIEVSPLDLSLTEPETHVGEAIADEVDAGPIYGEFDARLYKTNENSGDVAEISVKVKNLNPGSPIKQRDVETIYRAQDGTYYAAPGAASTSAYFATVTDLLPADGAHIACDIYTITDDDYEFLETANVLHLGDSLPSEDDEITVFRSAQGTYWTMAGASSGSFGMAKVSSNASNRTAIPCRLYNGTNFTGSGDEDITVITPALASGASVPAGTWMLVFRVGESWVGYLPLIRPRVA